MDCLRCGARDVSGPECPGCGVVLAKARSPRPRRPPPSRAPRRGRRPDTLSLVLLLVLAGAVSLAVWRGREAPAPPEPGVTERDAGPPPAPLSAPPPAPSPPEISLPPVEIRPGASDALPPDTTRADRATAERLAALLRSGARLGPDDLRAAEDLHARYDGPARPLLEVSLLRAAEQAQTRRDHAGAEALLRRAATVAPGSVHPPRALVGVLLGVGDWSGAESAARAALTLVPGDREMSRGLAYALVRQDRSREAMEILEDLLDRSDDAEALALLQRIQNDMAPEAGLVERRLAHFHVRYDGEEHERVGRAILRVLERHYATLVIALDHQPASPIAVTLLSRESYAAATGAPGWSGGLYDSFDGRVRIPIAGLTPALTPEMDGTLLHELTHAFVATISRGVAPREIHEGLAQLMEGKRVADLLDQRTLAALAEGRLGGVGGFYMASLSFVEYLQGQRGQGGLNDLLRAMAETGSVDAAFEQVYRRDVASLRRDWQARLRQQYGRL